MRDALDAARSDDSMSFLRAQRDKIQEVNERKRAMMKEMGPPSDRCGG